MKRIVAFFACAVLICSLYGCTKMVAKGNLSKSGIAFTFDDYSIDEWYRCLPLFDSFGVKATYYISNYGKLSKDQVRKLKIIKQHGHEIAFHSTNHFNMVKYVNNAGMEKLIKQEILAGLKKMNEDHFYPSTFAYPFGQHNDQLDANLLKYFKSVRALNGTSNLAKSMVTTEGNRVLYGLGIDESSKRPMKTILQLVRNTYNDNNCLVLVSHHIDWAETPFKTSFNDLRTIIKEASSLGMHFYTISEISQ